MHCSECCILHPWRVVGGGWWVLCTVSSLCIVARLCCLPSIQTSSVSFTPAAMDLPPRAPCPACHALLRVLVPRVAGACILCLSHGDEEGEGWCATRHVMGMLSAPTPAPLLPRSLTYTPLLWLQVEADCKAFRDRQVADPVLRAKLTPDHRAGCKRLLLCNEYYSVGEGDNGAWLLLLPPQPFSPLSVYYLSTFPLGVAVDLVCACAGNRFSPGDMLPNVDATCVCACARACVYVCLCVLSGCLGRQTYNRPNVELVTEGIAEVVPTGIRSIDGKVREFDVLVMATVRPVCRAFALENRYTSMKMGPSL